MNRAHIGSASARDQQRPQIIVPAVDVNRQFAPIALQGEIPNPANPPAGCRLHTRCPYADQRCHTDMPEWREIEPEHFVACHYAGQLELRNQ
jgi:peptide/nickel transport system ATP-binding protein